MELCGFRESLKDAVPPEGLSTALESLWWDAKGSWEKAHETAQKDEGRDSCWVHAYLHRAKGDVSNAKFWYRSAQRPAGYGDLKTEWESIAQTLLREREA